MRLPIALVADNAFWPQKPVCCMTTALIGSHLTYVICRCSHTAAQQQHREDLDLVRAQLETAKQSVLQLTGQLLTTRGEVTSLGADLTAAQVTAAQVCLLFFWQALWAEKMWRVKHHMCALPVMQAGKSRSDAELLAAQQRAGQLAAEAEQLRVSQAQEGETLSALQTELSRLQGCLKSDQVSHVCCYLPALPTIVNVYSQSYSDCTGSVLPLCVSEPIHQQCYL